MGKADPICSAVDMDPGSNIGDMSPLSTMRSICGLRKDDYRDRGREMRGVDREADQPSQIIPANNFFALSFVEGRELQGR